jgi:5-methylcytosine-specific restriction endonuclease McrA
VRPTHHRVDLSDDVLLSRLRGTLSRERQVTAEVLRLMAEVDRRRLYAQFACDSMFAFATGVLGLSEAAAYKRIQVARAGRRFPTLFAQIGGGRQHLSGLCVLVPHLTADNHRELLEAAAGLGKRQIEHLVAERLPRPDVATSMRKLPTAARPSGRPSARSEQAVSAPASCMPPAAQQRATAAARAEAVPSGAAPAHQSSFGTESQADRTEPAAAATPRHVQHHPQPLSADRYLLKVSVSGQLRGKLDQAQDLLRGQVPDGDIATVLEQALDALIAQQLKNTYAVGAKARRTKPQQSQISPTASSASTRRSATSRSRAIPAAIRREVYRRDGGQCRFVDAKTGRRCQARAQLQFHHQVPFARGGRHSVDNVVLLCATHNAHMARRDYGAAHIQAAIDARTAGKEAPTPPGASRSAAGAGAVSGHRRPAVDATASPWQPAASSP